MKMIVGYSRVIISLPDDLLDVRILHRANANSRRVDYDLDNDDDLLPVIIFFSMSHLLPFEDLFAWYMLFVSKCHPA